MSTDTVGGSVKEVRLLQFCSTPRPMEVRVGGRVREVRPQQPDNICGESSDVRLSGSTGDLRPLQSDGGIRRYSGHA